MEKWVRLKVTVIEDCNNMVDFVGLKGGKLVGELRKWVSHGGFSSWTGSSPSAFRRAWIHYHMPFAPQPWLPTANRRYTSIDHYASLDNRLV